MRFAQWKCNQNVKLIFSVHLNNCGRQPLIKVPRFGGFTGSPTVRLTNAIFQGNSGANGVVVKSLNSALEFNGCLTFSTTFGLDSGVHFRQLDGAGIGVQAIIDAGFLEAFDVWGYVEQGVEVCFPQIGRVIFLDARASPRAIVPLESTVTNGQTCVSMNSPGSLVLLPN